jgi:hypothetical protein
MSTAIFPVLLQSDEAGLRSPWVAKKSKEKRARPVFHRDIAADLRAMRGGKSATLLIIAAEKKGHTLSPQKLRGVEVGTTRYPDRDVLEAVAAAHGLDYQQLAWRYVTANYGLTPDYALPPLAVPLEPGVQTAAQTLELLPSPTRTALIELIRTLGEGRGTDR